MSGEDLQFLLKYIPEDTITYRAITSVNGRIREVVPLQYFKDLKLEDESKQNKFILTLLRTQNGPLYKVQIDRPYSTTVINLDDWEEHLHFNKKSKLYYSTTRMDLEKLALDWDEFVKFYE